MDHRGHDSLGILSVELDEEGPHESGDRIGDVTAYARGAGERPPVNGWTSKV
ncbi:hypothetical protein ACFWHQ_14810 [Streptomyces sp. NPDC060334]|uniref:hypothetical protein n=1 Tax=Streptomyces sp. NPDC060334 TaxID=3347099 RepID=UPI00365697AD